MTCPFRAAYADPVIASVFCCFVSTAVSTHTAVGTNIGAVIANTATGASFSTFGAVISALFAEGFSTVYTPVAVLAHSFRTLYTDAAFGAEFVNTTGALAAVGAELIGTVTADLTAFLADIGTVTALLTVSAPDVLSRTFTAKVTGYAELVVAFGTFLTALGAKIGALLASLTAGAGYGAAAAKSARRAEAVGIGAITAGSAFDTNISVRAG